MYFSFFYIEKGEKRIILAVSAEHLGSSQILK